MGLLEPEDRQAKWTACPETDEPTTDVKARVALEAGSTMGRHEWTGRDGAVIGIDRFGASAPCKELYKQYGITTENVVARAKAMRSEK